jgi:glycerophosphoryl diester phosphodiesterase
MIRLFAHRGFTNSGKLSQNSVQSLKAAYENGFRSVEFDIWFFDEKLVLKHDQPQKTEINNLPIFSDYFSFKNEMNYWCDFKNLNEKNCEAALKKVKENIVKAALNFDQIYFAPFITDYKISEKIFKKFREIFGDKIKLVAVCEELENSNQEKILRDFLTENKIKFLSIFHKLIDKNFIKTFPDIELFVWTVNDLGRLRDLEQLGVKNFATDSITPKDLN